MAHLSLVEAVSDWFTKYEVPATVVWGQRARPAQGNAKSGSHGGRVSFQWPGKSTGQGPTYLGPRAADNTIADGGLIALAQDVYAARTAHWSTGAPVHLVAAAPINPPAPTNLAGAFDAANAIRILEIAHHANLTLHVAADTENAITAPAAHDRASLRTLLLQLQEQGNAHDRQLFTDLASLIHVHNAVDEEHDSTAPDPLSTGATSRAIAQLVIELEAEVWAWDDAGPTDDRRQEEAWWSLMQATANAVRSYARGVFRLDRTEAASPVVHTVRGVARLVYFKLPVPIDQLPNLTPQSTGWSVTAEAEFARGAEPDGAPLDPETEAVGGAEINPDT